MPQELEREKKQLEGKAGRDYGVEDAFLPLDGRCFSVSVDKYTYEVCPYGSAQQKDGGMSTRYQSHAPPTPHPPRRATQVYIQMHSETDKCLPASPACVQHSE